jgi:tetratricopeptide (TPR) repeat protein
VQRAGDRIRVTAQLIDAETDAHLWAANYEEALTTENLFAIQSQIARMIAEALEAQLTQAEEVRIERLPTENLEAYDLYNRARYLTATGKTEMSIAALDLFREATQLDPEFAEAHAAFARTYLNLDFLGEVSGSAEEREEAREAVRRALSLDPDLAQAHLAHGAQLEVLDVDLDGAVRAYRRAIELSPSSSAAHFKLGFLFMNRGQFEDARAMFRRAVALDPRSLSPRVNLAFTEFVERDYVEAERQAAQVVEIYPARVAGYYILSGALSFQDRHDEAIAAARRAVELDPASTLTRIQLAFVYARGGTRDSALAIADEVDARGGSSKEIALVHAALGDIDRAFEYLGVSLERSGGDLATLDIDPSADPLRDDPRYRDILRRAGLEK